MSNIDIQRRSDPPIQLDDGKALLFQPSGESAGYIYDSRGEAGQETRRWWTGEGFKNEGNDGSRSLVVHMSLGEPDFEKGGEKFSNPHDDDKYKVVKDKDGEKRYYTYDKDSAQYVDLKADTFDHRMMMQRLEKISDAIESYDIGNVPQTGGGRPNYRARAGLSGQATPDGSGQPAQIHQHTHRHHRFGFRL